MATLTRSAVVAATPAAIWEVVSDAYTFPRWWPAVTRVEGVTETGFTEVLYSKRGRPVRLDLHYTEVEEAESLGFALEIHGSQFERLLLEWSTRLTLVPEAEDATRVTLAETQRFRGSFKTGTIWQRRAAKRRLNDALAGLADLF
jgi:uncharacterized protein YndB with AHSA1/START domain